jgi:hypothetical protein
MAELIRANRFLLTAFCFWFVAIGGCATETLKPTFPTASGLKRPDRVLVHEFAVTSADLQPGAVVGSGLTPATAQTEEDIRVGRALAKALTDNLIGELKRRGISASAAGEMTGTGEDTASIRGQFQSIGQGEERGVGFTLRGEKLRTHIQVSQGSGLDLRLVAQAEYTMQSNLRPGASSEAVATAVSANANRAAQVLAERVADYYRKQGWLQ